MMRKKSHKQNRKAGSTMLVKGILVGGVVGATLGWFQRRFRGRAMSARERLKTAAGNIEGRVRELAEEVRDPEKMSTARRKRNTAVRS